MLAVFNVVAQLNFMGFLASLFGRGQPPADPLSDGISVIDYEHESGGVCYHGTISLAGGQVVGGWSVDDGKAKKSHAIAMTVQTFRDIWNAMSEIPDFKAGLVGNPDQQLDPSANHVIGLAYNLGKEEKEETYMIPAATASPAFREWLSKIGYMGK